MTPERLLELYDEFSDAPGAVERLRQFVLELATRGKLTEQVESDFGQLLLDEIIRCNGANSQKKRNSSSLRAPQADTAELKKILPQNWALATLGQVASTITDGTHHTPTYVENGVPFVTVKNFSNGNLSLENTKKITVAEHKKLIERVNPRRGDILIARIGTLGKAVVVDIDTEFSIFVSVGLIRFDHQFINPTFFRLMLNSPFVSREFDRIKVGGGTHTNKLNLSDLHTVAFPLPPIEEQGRIVARVDELMGLCDELEAAEGQQRATRDRFTTASFDQIRRSGDDENNAPHGRFYAIDCFAQSTLESAQITSLKKLIIDLAVSGKLVKEDEKEGLASTLFSEIQSVIKDHVKGAALRRLYSMTVDAPFSIPERWSWAGIRQITVDRGQLKPSSQFTYIDVGAINKERGSIESPQILEASEAPSRARKIVAKGDVLYSCVRPYLLNVAVVDHVIDPAPIASTAFAVLNPLGLTNPIFLWLVLRSSYFIALVEERMRGQAYPAINDADFASMPVPLPPLGEQERIVAKVDELMGLCDELEAALVQKQTLKVKLLESALSAALNPSA